MKNYAVVLKFDFISSWDEDSGLTHNEAKILCDIKNRQYPDRHYIVVSYEIIAE